MDRRTFLTLSGIGAAGLLLPNTRLIAAKQVLTPNDAARSRRLSDTALSTAKAAVANYCDVRVSNYLRQFVITSEAQVENVVNAESSGVCALADGAWGLRHQHADSDGDRHRHAGRWRSPRPTRGRQSQAGALAGTRRGWPNCPGDIGRLQGLHVFSPVPLQ